MSLLDIDKRTFSSFCFTSPFSLISFSFVLVSIRISTVARLRGESDWSTGSQTQIISSTWVSITRRISRRPSLRWIITRKEHHWVFQSRSRIKNPEAASASQQLARLRRNVFPTKNAFVNESETMFLKQVFFHSKRSRKLESRSVSVINELLTGKERDRNESINQSMREHPGDAKKQKKSQFYFNDENMSLEKYWVGIKESAVQWTCETPW